MGANGYLRVSRARKIPKFITKVLFQSISLLSQSPIDEKGSESLL